jgi:hypothetical protein
MALPIKNHIFFISHVCAQFFIYKRLLYYLKILSITPGLFIAKMYIPAPIQQNKKLKEKLIQVIIENSEKSYCDGGQT